MSMTLLDRPAPIVDDATRRQFLTGLAAAGLLAGCGSDPGADPASPAAGGAFPVTIEHEHGSTVIPTAPVRIVTVGNTDQDYALALGVVPVGVRDWFGEQPFAIWPWARDALGDAQPEVLAAAELNLEQIATLAPDLIVALSGPVPEPEYAALSRIAPTIVEAPGRAFSTPWQEITRVLGRALGRAERAEQLVAEVEGRLAEARARYPQFGGAGVVVGDIGAPGPFYLYGPERGELRVLGDVGFEPAPLPEVEFTPGGVAELSAERIGLVEADVVVWYAEQSSEPAHVVENRLYQELEVAQAGRHVFLGYSDPLAGAIAFASPLSLPFLLDGLLPRLAAAIDGDPATQISA